MSDVLYRRISFMDASVLTRTDVMNVLMLSAESRRVIRLRSEKVGKEEDRCRAVARVVVSASRPWSSVDAVLARHSPS